MINRSFKILIITFLFFSFSIAQSQVESQLAERLENHVRFLSADSLEGRSLGSHGRILAQNYIADAFSELGIKPLFDDYCHHFDVRSLYGGVFNFAGCNVVGVLEGSNPILKDEYIVIGAHYDHLGYEMKDGERIIYSGADDNASGVAVMLEIARHFSENRHRLKRSIIFIGFDAEESGLLGSREFVKADKPIKNEQIKIMFSLDMLGMYNSNKGLILHGIGAVKSAKRIAVQIALKNKLGLRKMNSRVNHYTDTYYFGDTQIPAVHAFTGYHFRYHTPADTAGLLEYDGMEKVTHFLKDLVTEISEFDDIKPTLIFLSRYNAIHFNAGSIVGLGISNHNFLDEFFMAKPLGALNLGILFQIHIGKDFTFQPEVHYNWYGSKTETRVFRVHAITIPLNLQYNLKNFHKGLVRRFISGGIYYRYNFTGKHGSTSLDFENLVRQKELGYTVGYGIERYGAQLSINYHHGLTRVFLDRDRKEFNSGISVNLGSTFENMQIWHKK